jgi:hypothetical protein
MYQTDQQLLDFEIFGENDMAVTFKQDKTTKNTVRFTASGGEVSGSIYIQKDSDLAKNSEIVVKISQ